MKFTTLARVGFVSTVLPLLSFAQTTTGPQAADVAVGSGDPMSYDRERGDREFTIGGSGAANKDFNDSLGGVSFSYGSYVNEAMAVVLRQSVSYSNPSDAGTEWNGATKVAFDYHFIGDPRWRPFVGVNAGRIYGESVRDTWAAGLEGGLKYYVLPRTFIAATLEYGWLFQHSKGVEDRFDDGQWNWSLGVGFNF